MGVGKKTDARYKGGEGVKNKKGEGVGETRSRCCTPPPFIWHMRVDGFGRKKISKMFSESGVTDVFPKAYFRKVLF